MKILTFKILILFTFLNTPSIQAQATLFEFDSNQSMLMTGKGPGQDGAINPFYGSPSIAVVNNVGEIPIEVRIQKRGEIIKIVEVKAKVEIEIKLERDHELYFDVNATAAVELDFKPMK